MQPWWFIWKHYLADTFIETPYNVLYCLLNISNIQCSQNALNIVNPFVGVGCDIVIHAFFSFLRCMLHLKCVTTKAIAKGQFHTPLHGASRKVSALSFVFFIYEGLIHWSQSCQPSHCVRSYQSCSLTSLLQYMTGVCLCVPWLICFKNWSFSFFNTN